MMGSFLVGFLSMMGAGLFLTTIAILFKVAESFMQEENYLYGVIVFLFLLAILSCAAGLVVVLL